MMRRPAPRAALAVMVLLGQLLLGGLLWFASVGALIEAAWFLRSVPQLQRSMQAVHLAVEGTGRGRDLARAWLSESAFPFLTIALLTGLWLVYLSSFSRPRRVHRYLIVWLASIGAALFIGWAWQPLERMWRPGGVGEWPGLADWSQRLEVLALYSVALLASALVGMRVKGDTTRRARRWRRLYRKMHLKRRRIA